MTTMTSRERLLITPTLLLAVILATSLVADPVIAASPHFIGTPTIPKNPNGSLTTTFKGAGLANIVAGGIFDIFWWHCIIAMCELWWQQPTTQTSQFRTIARSDNLYSTEQRPNHSQLLQSVLRHFPQQPKSVQILTGA